VRAQFETRRWVFHGFYWLALYGVLWGLLAGASGWGFGALCILAAVLVYRAPLPIVLSKPKFFTPCPAFARAIHVLLTCKA
jgi:hypothetical protein